MRQFTSRAPIRMAAAAWLGLSACTQTVAPPAAPARAERFAATDVRIQPDSSVPAPRVVRTRVPSPDGRSEAYFEPAGQGLESSISRVMVAPVGGPGREIARAANAYGLAWHPGGAVIAFSEGALVHLADADGQTRTIVYSGPGGPYPGACFDLAWTGIGQTLSFAQVESVENDELANPASVTVTLAVR